MSSIHTQFKKGMTPWNRGKKGVYTAETRIKMGLANIGRIPSPDTIEKRRKANIGKIPWNKGIKWEDRNFKHSEETKALLKITRAKQDPNTLRGIKHKMPEGFSEAISKRITGEGNPKWIKDRTMLVKKQERNDSAYVDWRKQVWLRDNFTCKIANPNCLGKIEAHHILNWKDYPELRYQLNNGITLCHAHHPRVRSEEKRLVPTFHELVSVSNELI